MFPTPDRVCSRLLELFEWIRNFFGKIHFKKEPLKETEHWREKNGLHSSVKDNNTSFLS